jgi:hypothetical protein
MAVGIRIDGHRLDAHLGTRAHDAHGNLSSVGDEYFFNHWEFPVRFGSQRGNSNTLTRLVNEGSGCILHIEMTRGGACILTNSLVVKIIFLIGGVFLLLAVPEKTIVTIVSDNAVVARNKW